MIWTERLDHLKIFVDYLNNIHPTIKFTSNHSLTNIPFLDVMVSLNNGTIETDLYTKPTDKHQHLLSSSCHPQHTKKAIPFSLALRIRRICSTDTNFTLRLMNLEHISSHEVMVTLSLTHNSNVLLIFLALKLYILTVTIPLTACLLLLHITHHFLTSLISYVNIFIYYFPLNAARKFLSTHPSSLTDVLLTFATF